LLIAAGVPVKVLSERLGHATPAFTIDTYQHVLPGMQADAARIFERLVVGDFYRRTRSRGRPGRSAGRRPPELGKIMDQQGRPRSLTWAFTHSLVAGAGFEPATFGL